MIKAFKDVFKYILCLLLCAILLVPTAPAKEACAYTDGFILIGDVSIPFAEYMPGTYFTKNGTACTCHNNASVNCVANGVYCNCTRYVTVEGKQIDLLAVQCIGFARYCFYRIFGFIDHPQLSSNLYYNAGSLSYGQVTATSVKQLFSALKPGAHIRFNLAASQHSVILLSQFDGGFTVYQCNSGGNGIPQENCIISTKTYTWESFASYAYRGIEFANMPYNYPEKLEYSDTPYEPIVRTDGIFTTTENLKLRAEPNTESEWLDTISVGTEIYVAEMDNGWGRVVYNGKQGYISLAYAYYTREAPKLSSLSDKVYAENGYLYGLEIGQMESDVKTMFEREGITTTIAENATVKTGDYVHIVENEKIVYTAIVVIAGDVNCDGALSTADCLLIKALLVGEDAAELAVKAADINGDGTPTTADYKKLKLLISQTKT